MVSADEVAAATQAVTAASQIASAPTERLPGLWDKSTEEVKRALKSPPDKVASAVSSATGLLMSLIDRAPDVALAQVVRQPSDIGSHYGVTHSIGAATACLAVVRTLGWNANDQQRAFQAALTMNIAMLDLQARLAGQASPLTGSQRQAIREHPTRGAEMLAEAGISDPLWLMAVTQHHEAPDGSGYPGGITAVSELAQLLRCADIYTALLSARASRPAMGAREAGREVYQMAADSPYCAALIKSFGIFPPGSCVRLASGELGVVARNGEKAYHPQVAALTSADGSTRLSPLMRDSARAEHAVVALLPEKAMPMRLTPEKLATLIAAA
jgi:HD-GYP domain-containing protein (c-di-GMP phosphodiesterase class II)